MEQEQNQFSPELLQMMRDEEREKFLAALKNGASWGQLYNIRHTIKRLNDMIAASENMEHKTGSKEHMHTRGSAADEQGPRSQ